MEKAEVQQELEQVKGENLIKNYEFKNNPGVTFSLVTLEDHHLIIEATVAGYVLQDTGEIFETFEQLLSKRSEGYEAKFASVLTSKLEKLREGESD